MKKMKFILSGGGTGGHIYPAIAIADELKKRYPQADFLFVGAKDRMEMQKVPQAGYPIEGLWISGIQRKLTLKNLAFPFKLLSSLMKSKQIIKQFKPDLVIGTGGFASGPLLKAANQKNIPTVLQEQNSYAGITNKWLADKADKICVAYENMSAYFPNDKIVLTGNPVRQDLLNVTEKRTEAQDYFKLDKQKTTLLVLGGSLGARTINQTIANHLDWFKTNGIQIIWQCGKFYYDQYKTHAETGFVQVHAFLEKMDLAYAAADIVISRSGALSVSELCLVGKPVVFIPSPNVAEDHQTKNANALADKKAALVIKEQNITTDFKATFSQLLASPAQQEELAKNIKSMAKPQATQAIVDEIEKLLNV